MSIKLQPIPDIPDALRLAATEGRLVPFIGAGASRLAGCPGWDEFADNLLRQLLAKKILNFSKFEQIRAARFTPRIKLSLAINLANEAKLDFDFSSAIHPNDEKLQNALGRRLYTALSQLANVFVTTNYDRWLNEPLSPDPLATTAAIARTAEPPTARPRKVTYKVPDINASLLAVENSVIHLHGSLADPSTMIMTTGHYLRHYRVGRAGESENNIIAFLRHLFAEKVVLFIGYGLEDLEILEYVTLKALKKEPATQPSRHFLLQPFFSHDAEIAANLDAYYRGELGVQMLPFLRDDQDYGQLVDVISEFARQIPANNPMRIQRQSELAVLFDG